MGAVGGASYTILPAAPEHVGTLPDIERSADSRFGSQVPPQVLGRVIPIPVLEAAQRAGHLWVALPPDGTPVGFALVEPSGTRLHLEGLAVVPEYGRRGIGTALVSAVGHWAKFRGFAELTLTTYVDFPWNADYYAKIGFEPVLEGDLDAEMLRRLETEDALGLQRARRIAMRKRLPAG